MNAHPLLQYGLGDHVLIRPKLLPPAGIVEEVVNLAAGFVEGLVRSVTDSNDEATAHQRQPSSFATENIDWMGEVVRIHSDGTLRVRLAREVEPPPEWTGERYDVVKAEDLLVFEVNDEDQDEEMDDIVDADYWVDNDGEVTWNDSDVSDEEWEDASEGDMDTEIPEASLDGMDEVQSPEHTNTNGHLDVDELASPMEIAPVSVEVSEWRIDKEKCPGFEILEDVPDDHPFKSDSPGSPPREWFVRIRKEHKILQTSLPEGILVRTYESRLDLMRVLILGPKNTPYENAPFLFDFSLADSFPTEPPEAFFHSWTPGGSGGRVNPNLYVYVTSTLRLMIREGRVCLSLLGTWHSQNDTESWNSKQSTLLQLFLSIQSLVLTARPYYNEAGFGAHLGLDEASVNERLYSERAYFLSRGFVKWALENAVEGLEKEIRYLYVDEDGLQLAKSVIEDGKQVIARSEANGDDDGEWESGRVTRLSRGGQQVLQRTIVALERLVAEKSAGAGSGA